MAIEPLDNWQQYEDATRLYRLVYPPSWRFERRADGISVFLDVDVPRSVTVATQPELTTAQPSDLVDALMAQRPGATAIGATEMLSLHGCDAARARYVEQGDQGSQHWIVQFMTGPGFHLAAAFHCPEHLADLLQPEGLALLDSIELTDSPPMDRAAFFDAVADIAKRLLTRCEIQPQADDFSLQIDEMVLRLDNLYLQYRQAPEALDELAGQALHAFVTGRERYSDLMGYDQARQHLMPILRPKGTCQKDLPATLASVEFVNEAVIHFVIDQERTMRYLTLDDLHSWAVTVEQVQLYAIANLAGYRRDLRTHTITDNQETLALVLTELDGYDAARLLLPDLHARLSKALGSPFLVGVPNRDFFIAFRMDDHAFCRRVANQVRNDFASMDHPVCERLFLISRDGVSGYDELDQWPEPS